MQITLGPDVEPLIKDEIESGKYASPEDVVLAGLQTLAREREDDFAPGELDALIAQGERRIQAGGTLDVNEAFEARRRWRARR